MHYVTPREEALYSKTRVFDSVASSGNSGNVGCNEIPRCPMSHIVGILLDSRKEKNQEEMADISEGGTRRCTDEENKEKEKADECTWCRVRKWPRMLLEARYPSPALRERWRDAVAPRERCVWSENRSCFRGFFLSRVRCTRIHIQTYIQTHAAYTHEDENDAREGERENLARVWHTGLPVKTCEGRHQMLFRTRLSRSAAHTQCLGKIETGERIMAARTRMLRPIELRATVV